MLARPRPTIVIAASNLGDLSSSQGLMHTILRPPTPVMGSFLNERQDKTERLMMNVSFDLPPDIEEQVRREGADLNSEAREVYLVLNQASFEACRGQETRKPPGFVDNR